MRSAHLSALIELPRRTSADLSISHGPESVAVTGSVSRPRLSHHFRIGQVAEANRELLKVVRGDRTARTLRVFDELASHVLVAREAKSRSVGINRREDPFGDVTNQDVRHCFSLQ